jgi:hypothetical protein
MSLPVSLLMPVGVSVPQSMHAEDAMEPALGLYLPVPPLMHAEDAEAPVLARMCLCHNCYR